MLNILALEQFIDALPDPDIRLRLKEARPKDINDAEIIAIRLETIEWLLLKGLLQLYP